MSSPTTAQSTAVTDWLAAYARGEVSDPNTAFLDKVIRERIAAAAPARAARNGAVPQTAPTQLQVHAEVIRLIDAVTRGETPDSPAGQRIAAALAEARAEGEAEAGGRPVRDAVSFAAYERLRQEVSRAHNWRFHLESRARAVHAAVGRLLDVEHRAPTEVEMREIVDTLREAVEWAP